MQQSETMPPLRRNSISARVNVTPKTRPNPSPKNGNFSKKGFLLVSIAFLAVVVLAFVLSRVLRNPLDLEIPMIHVQGGVFQMGASESGQVVDTREQPAHDVSLWSYNIARHEVTQAQWKAVMGHNPSIFKGNDLPVENISWNDVQEFIQKLNTMTGKKYRLPTEAEWEYAARGGIRGVRIWKELSVEERNAWLAKHPHLEGRTFGAVSNTYDNNNFVDAFGMELFYEIKDKSIRDKMLRKKGNIYSGSNEIDQVAWYGINANSQPHPIGTKSPNALGIYDMSGNLAEWCSDWYGNYSESASSNPKGPSAGTFRVVRGGSWDTDKEDCKVISRNYAEPDYRSSSIGFRLALDIVTP